MDGFYLQIVFGEKKNFLFLDLLFDYRLKSKNSFLISGRIWEGFEQNFNQKIEKNKI